MNEKRKIIEISHKLYDKGYITAFDGNVSIRNSDGSFWLTPSKLSKETIAEHNLIRIDREGKVLEGSGNATSELPMHLEAYRQRPDVKAVIHAHPKHVTACTLSGIALNQCILPEIIIALGSIAQADYATPCTGEGASSISELVKKFNSIVLDRHGAITVGENLNQAFHYLEKTEQFAQILLMSNRSLKTLESAEIDKILKVCGKTRDDLDCDHCNCC